MPNEILRIVGGLSDKPRDRNACAAVEQARQAEDEVAQRKARIQCDRLFRGKNRLTRHPSIGAGNGERIVSVRISAVEINGARRCLHSLLDVGRQIVTLGDEPGTHARKPDAGLRQVSAERNDPSCASRCCAGLTYCNHEPQRTWQ